MDNKEHKAFIEKIERYTAKLLKSETGSKVFFQSVGIYTKSGKLTKRYSNPIPEYSVKIDNK